jgi:hypothetical protein
MQDCVQPTIQSDGLCFFSFGDRVVATRKSVRVNFIALIAAIIVGTKRSQ